MRKVAAALVVVLALVPSTVRADFDGGMAAYRDGDYSTAFTEFMDEAKAGLPSAQHNVGAMYFRGESVAKDYVRAYAWFALAARSGDHDSSEALEVVRFKLSGAEINQAEHLASKFARENSFGYIGQNVK